MARTNNLTNFLTDVASAIKTKTGDSTAIPASQFDTKIANISTGHLDNTEYTEANDDVDDILENTVIPSGTLSITENGSYDVTNYISARVNVPSGIPDIESLSTFNTQIAAVVDKFNTFLQTKIASYPVYTENPITLYKPKFNNTIEMGNHYIIHKRSSGKYRIIWGSEPYAVIRDNGNDVGFMAYHITMTESNLNDGINYLKTGYLGTSTQRFMYSAEVSTIEELIQQITNPNNTLTYNNWTSGGYFGALLDSPYEITYTNMNIFDMRNNGNVLMSRKISANETYANRN